MWIKRKWNGKQELVNLNVVECVGMTNHVNSSNYHVSSPHFSIDFWTGDGNEIIWKFNTKEDRDAKFDEISNLLDAKLIVDRKHKKN